MDAATQLYGVMGYPVHHSLSPIIHNTAFKTLGINAVYTAFNVAPEALATAIAGARALGLAGFNLTIPHKQAIVPLLDWLDVRAQQIGAVNTVVNRQGQLCGYNTDAAGFCQPLYSKSGFNPKAANVVLLGAGGAARAVAFELAASGVSSIVLLNRNLERAQTLAAALQTTSPTTNISADYLREPVNHPALATADLVVQCTSRGLKDTPLTMDWGLLNKKAIVADLVYDRQPTVFLQQATAYGLRTHDGIWMLIGQAAQAFWLWTGQRFNIEQAKTWLS